MASSWEKSLHRRFKKLLKTPQSRKPADSLCGNSEANPVPGIVLPLGHEPWKLSISLEDLLKMEPPQSVPILPGLIDEGQTTLVWVAPGVDFKWYLNAIAVAVTAGISLGPYGWTTPCHTTLAYAGTISKRTREQMEMYLAKLKTYIFRKRVMKNLHLTSLRDIRKQQLMVNNHWHTENREALIQPEKRLVIFPDAHLAIGRHKDTWSEIYGDSAFQCISDPKIAVLACIQGDKRARESIHDSIWTKRPYRFVEFLPWPAAPQRYGAGLTVNIHKTSEHDRTPNMFDVWYWVEDSKIEIGWQIHNSAEPVSPKQTAIAERRRQVAEYVALDIHQKEIATMLKVNESTISRDVQAIKLAEAAAKKKGADDEEIDEAA